MPNFKIINSPKEITLNNQWTHSAKFNSKNRIVDVEGKAVSSDYKGRQYQIIEKRERIFSFQERIERGFLGTLAVVCTLFLYLFSKSVRTFFIKYARNLFIKSKENVRFGVLVPPSSNLSSQIVPSISIPSTLGSQIKLNPVKMETDQTLLVDPVKVKTNETLLIDPYPELTQAREDFLIWFREEDSELGKGEYDTLIAKVNTLSKDLPKKKITLHCDYFRWGFPLFYVEKPGQEKYIPVKRLDGIILKWQEKNTPNLFWPLKDPQDNSYFIPEITVNVVCNSHSGSEPTGQYLFRLYRSASASDKKSSSYRILEGLTSYGEDVQKELGNSEYKKLRQMIPSYPDLPDLEEKPFSFF